MEIKTIKKTDGYNLDFVEKQAKIIMERDGNHQPLAILSNKKEIFIFPMTFSGDREKQLTREFLRKFVQVKKIERYWIIIESWVSHNPHVDSASRDINRREALCISEFSIDKNIDGKMVTILFERDDKKIVWKERVLLDGDNKKGSFQSTWNFFKEDISKELGDEKEKARIADMVKRVEQADMSEEIKLLREVWKEVKVKDMKLTDDEIKEQLIKVIKTGKVGFKNAVIPEKFKLEDDGSISKKLKEVKKE